MSFRRSFPIRSLLLSSVIFSVVGSTTVSAAQTESEDRPIAIPINDTPGHTRQMRGHICIPEDTDEPRLVIINHGSPALASQRPGLTATSCSSETAQWFLGQGYAVMFVLRLGYGTTGGPWTETFGTCDDADYYDAGLETARQIRAMVAYAPKIEGIDASDIIVIGHSAGGWGTLAFNSMPHPTVGTVINMAAGRGGYQGAPNVTCQPERLVAAARHYGETASAPMLWIYAKNDHFFGPSLAQEMYEAYTAGDDQVQFEHLGSFGEDGHQLFFARGGSRIWGPIIEAYLSE